MLGAMPPSADGEAPLLADATGVLIAGGRAVRMGGLQKGWLRADGEPIAERTMRLYRRTFAAALVVANDPAPWERLGAPVVPDAIPAKGAPGGLHAALLHAKTEWIFTAGCDMPFLSAAGIALLASRREGAMAVIPRWDGWLEPLHAFWSRRCLPAVERLLREGEPSMQSLARSIGARIVEEEEWRAIDPAGRAFENVNTPEDAARLGLAAPTSEPGDAHS
jgi:molybdopterin-guanine dinucleotide biosynthesis protein A